MKEHLLVPEYRRELWGRKDRAARRSASPRYLSRTSSLKCPSCSRTAAHPEEMLRYVLVFSELLRGASAYYERATDLEKQCATQMVFSELVLRDGKWLTVGQRSPSRSSLTGLLSRMVGPSTARIGSQDRRSASRVSLHPPGPPGVFASLAFGLPIPASIVPFSGCMARWQYFLAKTNARPLSASLPLDSLRSPSSFFLSVYVAAPSACDLRGCHAPGIRSHVSPLGDAARLKAVTSARRTPRSPRRRDGYPPSTARGSWRCG